MGLPFQSRLDLPEGTDESGFWVHDETLGWLYTGKDLYPFFYRDTSSSWLYDQSSSSGAKVLGLCEQSDHHSSKKLADLKTLLHYDGLWSDATIVF